MNQSDIETMTEDEFYSLATSYFNIIHNIEHIPGMQSECQVARRSLMRLLSYLPEKVTKHDFYYDYQNSCYLVYPVICKQIKKITYYSNGLIKNTDSNHNIYCDSWKPKNHDAIKRYETKLHDCELQYNKIFGNSVEERIKAEELTNEKKFLNFFKNRDNLLMKYQYYRYLGKKFVVPKRFLIDGKRFYEFAEHLEKIMENAPEPSFDITTNEDVAQEIVNTYKIQMSKLEIISDKLSDFIDNFSKIIDIDIWSGSAHLSGYAKLSVCSFTNEEAIKTANKTNMLKFGDLYRSFNFSCYSVSVDDLPEDKKLNNYIKVYNPYGSMNYNKAYRRIYRALISYRMLLINNLTIPYFRDFCQKMGFIPPEKQFKTERID